VGSRSPPHACKFNGRIGTEGTRSVQIRYRRNHGNGRSNTLSVANDIDEALQEWARLLDDAKFFEAHEVLEELWLHAIEPERTFLKGLIHVAVALHHHQRGNGHGARVKYRSAERYLAPYQPGYLGIDLAGLFEQLRPRFAGLLGDPNEVNGETE